MKCFWVSWFTFLVAMTYSSKTNFNSSSALCFQSFKSSRYLEISLEFWFGDLSRKCKFEAYWRWVSDIEPSNISSVSVVQDSSKIKVSSITMVSSITDSINGLNLGALILILSSNCSQSHSRTSMMFSLKKAWFYQNGTWKSHERQLWIWNRLCKCNMNTIEHKIWIPEFF